MARITSTIEAASFSRLDVYEQCAKRGYFAFCQKIPEPERGVPHKRCPTNPATGEREWHNDRGTRLHDSMDKYIRGISESYDVELNDFDVEMTNARAAFENGMVQTEQMWCYKDDWVPTAWDDWDNTNMRIKLDVFQAIDGTPAEPVEAVAVDLKSGKIFGNEIKHASQLQLYALGAFKKFPTLELCHTELWYCDHNKLKTITYRRDQALGFQHSWDGRIEVMLSDVVFKASPSDMTCKWCPYRAQEDGGTGDCDEAYRYSQPVAPPGNSTKAKPGSRSRAG